MEEYSYNCFICYKIGDKNPKWKGHQEFNNKDYIEYTDLCKYYHLKIKNVTYPTLCDNCFKMLIRKVNKSPKQLLRYNNMRTIKNTINSLFNECVKEIDGNYQSMYEYISICINKLDNIFDFASITLTFSKSISKNEDFINGKRRKLQHKLKNKIIAKWKLTKNEKSSQIVN